MKKKPGTKEKKNHERIPEQLERSRVRERVAVRKERFLKAYSKSFVVSTACKKSKVGRTQIYEYIKDDPKFVNDIKDIDESFLDFLETQGIRQVKRGNVKMIQYFLDAKGKDRGYGKKTEITIKDKKANIIEPENDLDIDEMIDSGEDLSSIVVTDE